MIRLDRLQRGFTEALNGVAPVVAWGFAQPPHGELGAAFLSMKVVSGPTKGHRTHAQGTFQFLASTVTFRVLAALEATRNIARLNRFDYFYDVESGDTVTDVRDALLAAIVAGEADMPLTVAATGIDGIVVTATQPGALFELSIGGDLSVDDTTPDTPVIVTESTETLLVTLEAFSKQRQPMQSNSAWAIIARTLDKLCAHDTVETLSRYGVGLWAKGSVIDLSAIAGGNWESRCSVDLMVAMQSVSATSVSYIEDVEIE